MFISLRRSKSARKSKNTTARLSSFKPYFEVLEGRALPSALPLLSQQFFGGSGNEIGTGIAVVDTGAKFNVYTSGQSDVNGNEGLLVNYSAAYSLVNPSLVWNTVWPDAAGYDFFNGVAATSTAVYAAGASNSKTIDTLGGKEQKGITVSFPAAGGSSTWARQTPGAPGAFSYSGYEGLNAVTNTVESGQTTLYVAGTAQSNGSSDGYRLFVSKLDVAGNVLWTRADSGSNVTNGLAVAAAGGNEYVAGITNQAGTNKPFLQKYDSSGTLIWTRASTAGLFNGLMADSGTGFLYAVGRTTGPIVDSLVEKWDASGSLLWSYTYDRNGAEDILNGVTLLNGRLYAAGSTRGGTAGGSDGVVLELDPATGALLNSTLWGAAADDSFQGIAATPTGLHIVGTTNSYGSGGSDVAYVVYAAPLATTPTTTTVISGNPAGSTYGQQVTFTANVSAGSAGTTPPGAVQFQIDSSNYGAPVALTGGTASISTSTLGAGQHIITAFYTSDTSAFGNSDNSTNPLTQSVTPALLFITAGNKTKVFGSVNPDFTASYSSFVLGETPSVLSGTLQFQTTATQTSPAGTYAITPGGLTSKNYQINFVPGTLTVTPQVKTAPAVAIDGPLGGVRGQRRTFTFTATDPDAGDTAAGFWFAINWGDGEFTPIKRTSDNGVQTLEHVYTRAGTFVIRATASDQFGKASTETTRKIVITQVALQTDFADPNKVMLVVGGTEGCDFIRVMPASRGKVEVELNGKSPGTFAVSGHIVVYGQAGDDNIQVSSAIFLPALLDGGDGNDVLRGGSGDDILLGGKGCDTLKGGMGRDLLIAGSGADAAIGNSGEDILIAGTTAFDAQTQALAAVMAEWTSNRSLAARTLNLEGVGNGPRANGDVFLKAGAGATVFDDGKRDTIEGRAGIDLCFANLKNGVLDLVVKPIGKDVLEDIH